MNRLWIVPVLFIKVLSGIIALTVREPASDELEDLVYHDDRKRKSEYSEPFLSGQRRDLENSLETNHRRIEKKEEQSHQLQVRTIHPWTARRRSRAGLC